MELGRAKCWLHRQHHHAARDQFYYVADLYRQNRQRSGVWYERIIMQCVLGLSSCCCDWRIHQRRRCRRAADDEQSSDRCRDNEHQCSECCGGADDDRYHLAHSRVSDQHHHAARHQLHRWRQSDMQRPYWTHTCIGGSCVIMHNRVWHCGSRYCGYGHRLWRGRCSSCYVESCICSFEHDKQCACREREPDGERHSADCSVRPEHDNVDGRQLSDDE